jgi:hypothetical protein
VIVPAVLLMVLGAWVFLAPLVGPYFSFGFDTSSKWQFTNDHWLLSLAPGIAIFAAGVWLVIGPTLHPTWSTHTFVTLPGSDWKTAARWIADFYGAGALAIYLGAQAQGLLERRGVYETTRAAEPYRARPVPAQDEAPRRTTTEHDEQETVVSNRSS